MKRIKNKKNNNHGKGHRQVFSVIRLFKNRRKLQSHYRSLMEEQAEKYALMSKALMFYFVNYNVLPKTSKSLIVYL